MSIIKMTDLNLKDKKILIRADLNIPMKEKNIISDEKIKAFIPTINIALKKKAKIIITSHLGRPIEGEYNDKLSLKPIVYYLQKIFKNKKIILIKNYLEKIKIKIKENELIILENVRFNIGEKKNDEKLSKKYASLCDIFIMDAFASIHRCHSSTYGISKFAKISCAGPLLLKELNSLNKALKKPKRPMVAIVGGSKVSTKFNVLNSLAKIADNVIVGGGIANTFIAIDNKIGKSLYEPEFIETAKYLKEKYSFIIPTDCYVSTEFSETATSTYKKINEILDEEEIMDIGDKTINKIKILINKANTILWNGPVGVFEFKNFKKGTKEIAYSIAKSKAFSIAGGGDTLSAINIFNIKEKISYISTGGGAFLELIEGKELPVISILKKQKKKFNKLLL
ncbi:phosphoglycerate kinase [Candidatus Purcelliella pentastirinorum]|uniref:phosphoglycerate kinase n=1 Tax=Candidatus Purcelliella pentastirinorum TaxID=472834 RepID=UPI00237AB274|nr:phosphoglycerate kinase [Candidatus Purcelliella pentastirinorum]WDR80714.1 phosphoglycerate kinase [Candidatus Purcelliella pentastirinorum]